ncbi:molybdopterin-dependent oxidoreductase, partial [Kitasatospora saccharophila]|uniref:molybdopterin-dependent oxidoreductase n=1 Tax=Kitasatospora saccharophila TaxID=407973 RepID=UPI0031DB8FBF
MDNENPRRRPGPVTGAALGLAAAVAALGAGESAALATGPATSPVVAVGAAAVDLAPTALKEYAVREFGTHDKAVLLAGVLLTTALLALAAGVLTLRRPVAGAAVFGAFGLLGGWAALSRPVAAAADCGPSLLAGAVGALAAAALARLLHAAAVDPPAAPPVDPLTAAPPGRVVTRHLPGRRTGTRRTVTRRTALAATAGTFTAGATAGLAGRLLAQPPYDTAAVRVPPPARPLPPPPPAVRPNVAGLSPFTTPNGDFYRVDTALTLPRIDPRDWTLRIHGLVDRPQLLTFDDLLREPLEELDHTLSC